MYVFVCVCVHVFLVVVCIVWCTYRRVQCAGVRFCRRRTRAVFQVLPHAPVIFAARGFMPAPSVFVRLRVLEPGVQGRGFVVVVEQLLRRMVGLLPGSLVVKYATNVR